MDPRQEKLEADFASLCIELDNYLEDCYEGVFNRHPNRPHRGSGANPSFDGTFSTTAAFTLGYGSEHGRGYLINIDVRTLDRVSPDLMEEIKNRAFVFTQSKLPVVFPDRKLELVRDDGLLKIIGDFSLGDV